MSNQLSKEKNKNPKATVLFSGGLDSRLAVKVLQDQQIEVETLFFELPFAGGCCADTSCTINFSEQENIKHQIENVSSGPLFHEYLEIIKNPKHGRGSGMNPCKDCRIFIFSKAKEIAEDNNSDFIATGEVLNQRPMSQKEDGLNIIERESKLKGKLLRPLSAKFLEPTEAEKQGLVDRSKLPVINGRQRNTQIQLAKKYNITFPNPAGGCLLCEPHFSRKLQDLFDHKPVKEISPQEVIALNIGRHFRSKKTNNKIILGKDELQNRNLELLNKAMNWQLTIPKKAGPTAIFENQEDTELAKELIESHSSKDLKLRENYKNIKI
jgi:tRNA U34 2-thiouridine synthase MnmA/TrmU